MATKKQKFAAALAAVNLYLQEEEAVAIEQAAPLREPASFAFSPWGQSGRQEMMTMRRLIQLKAFSR
jgi:hypothetical protein